MLVGFVTCADVSDVSNVESLDESLFIIDSRISVFLFIIDFLGLVTRFCRDVVIGAANDDCENRNGVSRGNDVVSRAFIGG